MVTNNKYYEEVYNFSEGLLSKEQQMSFINRLETDSELQAHYVAYDQLKQTAKHLYNMQLFKNAMKQVDTGEFDEVTEYIENEAFVQSFQEKVATVIMLQMALNQLFGQKKISTSNCNYIVYDYSTSNILLAARNTASTRGSITKDITRETPPPPNPKLPFTLGGWPLDPQNSPIFKVGEVVNYNLQNPMEGVVYFAIVEISKNQATFVAPDSSFENFTPDQCTLPQDKECKIKITEGTFEVELLLSSSPFDFYSQKSLSLTEYENWKITHQNDIGIVITDMKYVGSENLNNYVNFR